MKILEADSMSEVDDELLQRMVLDAVNLFCQNFNSAHSRKNKPAIQLPYGKALRIITDHTVSDKLATTIDEELQVKAGSLLPKAVLPLSRHQLPRTLANDTVEYWQLLKDLDLEQFGDAIAAYDGSDGSYAVLAEMTNSDDADDELQELLDECVENYPVVLGEDVTLERWKTVLDTIFERGDSITYDMNKLLC